jgi:hypothetical protein
MDFCATEAPSPIRGVDGTMPPITLANTHAADRLPWRGEVEMARFIEDFTAVPPIAPPNRRRGSPHGTEGARNTVGDHFSRSSRLISPAGNQNCVPLSQTACAEGIPTLALNERRIVLDEMNRQRALVMEAIRRAGKGRRRNRSRVCRGPQRRSGARAARRSRLRPCLAPARARAADMI